MLSRKTGQLAISTLEEFIKGQEGELAVGKGISGATGRNKNVHPLLVVIKLFLYKWFVK